MAIHCFKKDAVGLGTLLIVYLMMVVGNLLFLFSALGPVLLHDKEWSTVATTELVVFETLWTFMFWSHTYCMCTEPGFIPHNYRYDNDKLPYHFKLVICPQQVQPSSNSKST